MLSTSSGMQIIELILKIYAHWDKDSTKTINHQIFIQPRL